MSIILVLCIITYKHFLASQLDRELFLKYLFICLAASGLSWGLWGLLLQCTGCFLVVACGLGSWGTQA